MNQTWENGKKTIFGPDFCLFLPKFVPPNFFLGFSSTRCSTLLQAITVYNSRKTSEPNLRQWQFWPSFGPDFAFFGPNLHPKNFLCGFYLYWMLDFVASYHCTQFQAKLMNQTWDNGKKFVLIIFFFFFLQKSGCKSLDIMVSYHQVHYQKKLMIQSRENLVTGDRWTKEWEWFQKMLSN